MAGIMAAQSADRNPFGNAMSGISEAAQGIQEGALEGGDLEGKGAALEGQAGSAGGGEVAGVAGMTGADLLKSRSIFGDMPSRQQSVGRGLGAGLGKFFGY